MAEGDIKVRLRTRPDGSVAKVYQGEYRDRDKKRRYVTGKTREKARTLLHDAVQEVKEGTRAGKAGNITLRQAAKEYLDDLDNVTKSSWLAEDGNIKRLSDRVLNTKLSEFKDSGLFEEEYKSLKRRGYSIRTANGVMQVVGRVLNFAMRSPRKYIPRNVLRDYPVKFDTPPKKANAIAVDDMRVLLEAAGIRQRYKKLLPQINFFAILCLMADTGCRPEEACALRVTDITRFEQPHPECPTWLGTVTFRRRFVKVNGFMRGLKEGADERSSAIGKLTLAAFDAIERYWQADRWANAPGYRGYKEMTLLQRIHKFLAGADTPLERRSSGLLFVTTQGNPYYSQSLAPFMEKLCCRLGFVQKDDEDRIILGKDGKPVARYTMYSIRKMVTNYNVRKLPRNVAAAQTGHTPQTLEEHYTQAMEQDQLLAAKVAGEREMLLRQICDKRLITRRK
jgi:integrase